MDVLQGGKKLAFPKSVVEMMQGAIGWPDGGFPKVLQKIILDSAGAKPLKGRPGAKMPKVDLAKELGALPDLRGGFGQLGAGDDPDDGFGLIGAPAKH